MVRSMVSSAEIIAMQHAISIAQETGIPKGPNPRVGCVILDESGEYLAIGRHAGKGNPHAEIDALQKVTGDLSNATAVVTLEPCLRSERDTDCSRALLKSGIKKVIIAQRDETALSRGGAEFLRQNGVEVFEEIMHDEASGINPWLTIAVNQQRPYLRLKIASTIDGKVAAPDGTSKWITSEESRNYVHELREQSHVIISSVKSAKIDNSKLTARFKNGELRKSQPLIILLGNEKLPKNHPVYESGNEVRVLTTLDLAELLQDLWKEQQLTVLIEAGPSLSTSFLRQGLVNELYWFTAPKLMGNNGLSAVSDLGVETLSEVKEMHLFESIRVGSDNLSIYRILADF